LKEAGKFGKVSEEKGMLQAKARQFYDERDKVKACYTEIGLLNTEIKKLERKVQ